MKANADQRKGNYRMETAAARNSGVPDEEEVLANG